MISPLPSSPHLASFFPQRYAREFEKPIAGFTPRALQRLCSYEFPGNARELQNIIQQAIVETRTGLIAADDLPVGDPSILETASQQGANGAQETDQSPDSEQVEGELDLSYSDAKNRATDAFERRYVTGLLARHQGNVTKASSAEKVSRKSLTRIVAKHRIRSGRDGSGGHRGNRTERGRPLETSEMVFLAPIQTGSQRGAPFSSAATWSRKCADLQGVAVSQPGAGAAVFVGRRHRPSALLSPQGLVHQPAYLFGRARQPTPAAPQRAVELHARCGPRWPCLCRATWVAGTEAAYSQAG